MKLAYWDVNRIVFWMMANSEVPELRFIDEKDFPLSSIRVVHVESEDEQPSDVDSSDSESSGDEETDEESENREGVVDKSESLKWQSCIQTPVDKTFSKHVDLTVDIENNSCIDFFELLFTDDVYRLIVQESIRFERQKQHIKIS